MGADLRTRRPALDGLRGLAVLLVLIGHSAPTLLPGGSFGVDMFFVLSGYLITLILLDDERQVTLLHFWQRRVRRILPALGMALMGTAALLLWLTDGARATEWGRDIRSALTFSANWRMLDKGVSYDELASGKSPFVHLWSVAVEEQFYLLWPLLLAIPVLRRRVRLLSGVVTVMGLTVAALIIVRGQGVDRLWYGTDVRAAQLGVGAMLAAGTLRLPTRRLWLVGSMLLAVVLGSTVTSTGATALSMFVVTVATSVLLVEVEQRPHGTLGRALSNRPLVLLGTVSYGVYLWHMPLLWAAGRLLGRASSPLLELRQFAVVAAASAVVAAMSWIVVEAPLLGRDRRRLGARTAVALSVVVFVCAGGAALKLAQPRGQFNEMATQARDWECPAGSPVCTWTASGRPDAWECGNYGGCLLYDPGRYKRTIIIAGDSVMRSLGPALVDQAQQHQWRLVGLVRNCGPHNLQGGVTRLVDGQERLVIDDTTPCQEFDVELAQALATWEAQTMVVGTGRSRESWMLPGSEHDPVFVRPGQVNYNEVYAQGMRAVLDVAASAGTKVLFVAMTEPAPVPDCDDESACPLFEPMAERLVAARGERTAQLTELREHADVTVFDPAELVCPQTPCPSVDDGFIWRYDGIHYTWEGSRRLIAELMLWLPNS